MKQSKCERCHRRDDCALRDLVVLTLPFAVEAHAGAEGEWERVHAVRRALRGSGASPGYAEDWILAGAMESEDLDRLLESIARTGRVDLAALCEPCRHYVGPALAEDGGREAASRFAF